MIRKVDDFLSAYESASNMTLSCLEALTDDALAREVAEGHRSIARIAWHITQTVTEMLGKVGLAPEGPGEDALVPGSAAEIVAAYRVASASAIEQVRECWTDETLLEKDEMYGAPWKRGFTLHALMTHEAHHRGQMTVLMRQAGLRVPPLFGPAKEDWASFGMEPPAV